ncbi:hypothetical protein SUGI_0081930 [Cryptomeria japonica]|nr:hypothetical protein SUGI_0081930 [Cryptomeria japonica]
MNIGCNFVHNECKLLDKFPRRGSGLSREAELPNRSSASDGRRCNSNRRPFDENQMLKERFLTELEFDMQRNLQSFPFSFSEGNDGNLLIHVPYLEESYKFTPQILGMLVCDLRQIAKDNGAFQNLPRSREDVCQNATIFRVDCPKKIRHFVMVYGRADLFGESTKASGLRFNGDVTNFMIIVNISKQVTNDLLKNFVKYCALWCGHCQALAHKYVPAAMALKGEASLEKVNVDYIEEVWVAEKGSSDEGMYFKPVESSVPGCDIMGQLVLGRLEG